MFWRAFITGMLVLMSFFVTEYTFAMKLSPDSSDLIVTPGEMAVATIEVGNDGDVPQEYRVRIVEVLFGENADQLTFAPLSATEEAWFAAQPASFALTPGKEQSIDIRVIAPANAAAQSMTIAALVEEVGEVEGTVSTASASLLFLHIGEGIQGNVEILRFEALPSWTFGDSVALAVLYRNTGSDSTTIYHGIRVVNIFGREVDAFALSDAPKRIPPGTLRGLSASWPEEKRLLFGEYRFELIENGRVLGTTSVTFLSPIFLLGFGVGIALLILGILLFVRKGRQQR